MEDLKATLQEMTNSFFPYAKERLGFDRDPQIFLRSDEDNASEPLGKTAFYDPENFSVVLYVNNRHPKDIMRSLSHELVHHTQNCRGDFKGGLPTQEGYAQEDEHLREMEREAYEQGNLVFRDWEDQEKKKNKGNIMEANTKKIEKEIADAKKNRIPENTKEIQKNIQDTLNDRGMNLNDQIMKKWGYKKPKSSE